jgi:hypothetical protein
MHRITLLSVTLLALALAAPGAAEEPGETPEQRHAELLGQLARHQGELTERLQQEIEARMSTQISAASAFNSLDPLALGHDAGSATRAAVARSR